MEFDKAKRQKRNIILADAGLLMAALFWGGGFVAGKFALVDLSPMNIMAYRYVGAALVLAIFCIGRFRKVTKKMVLSGGLIGILMFVGNTVQTIGLQYTTPGKQSFIISLYTVLVPLFSWVILKVKPSRRIIAAAVIALIGIALLTLRDDFTIGLGDFLTFIFAVTFSIQVVLIGIFMKDMDAMLFSFMQIVTVGALSAVAVFIVDTPQSLMGAGTASLAGLVYLIVFNSALAFLLQNLCQRFAPANHAVILLSTETVFGTVFAVTLAGEVFAGRMILGCILMFAALFVAEVPVRKKEKRLET